MLHLGETLLGFNTVKGSGLGKRKLSSSSESAAVTVAATCI